MAERSADQGRLRRAWALHIERSCVPANGASPDHARHSGAEHCSPMTITRARDRIGPTPLTNSNCEAAPVASQQRFGMTMNIHTGATLWWSRSPPG